MEGQTISHAVADRCAVVTGANKGIGLGICRQLASNGIMVILTARDEKRGLEAVKQLKESGLSNVVFHQLDVKDSVSIASLADFIKTQFGKLDILLFLHMASELEGQTTSHPVANRCAVVTGANKGIGLGICRQLASNGVMVILTARDEKRGLEAVRQLKESGLSNVVFHQLDVKDSVSIASMADFIKTQFGKLDILVNNAGVSGIIADGDAFRPLNLGADALEGEKAGLLKGVMRQTFEKAEECMAINYYGCKEVTEALIPLLLLSNSARIVNVSSGLGQLKFLSNEMAKEVLGAADGLTEEKVDEVLQWFLKDFKEDLLEPKGWPTIFSAYRVSKTALNAYTRILAKKFPTFRINCICPGSVKTDINFNVGILTVEEGAKGPVMLALIPDDGPTGLFYNQMEVSTY